MGWGGGFLLNTGSILYSVVLPALMFSSIVATELGVREVGVIVAFTLLLIAAVGAVTLTFAVLLRVSAPRRPSLFMSTTLQNTGNFGMTLQRLAFSGVGRGVEAMSLQAFVMLTQNIVAFTAGVVLASWNASRRGVVRNALSHMVRLPPLARWSSAWWCTRREAGWSDESTNAGSRVPPHGDGHLEGIRFRPSPQNPEDPSIGQ